MHMPFFFLETSNISCFKKCLCNITTFNFDIILCCTMPAVCKLALWKFSQQLNMLAEEEASSENLGMKEFPLLCTSHLHSTLQALIFRHWIFLEGRALVS